MKLKSKYIALPILLILFSSFSSKSCQNQAAENASLTENHQAVQPAKPNSPVKKAKSEKTETQNKEKKGNTKRLIEVPAKLSGTPERMLYRMAYTLSFNRETNQPNWVAWCLEDYETDGNIARRNEFLADEDIPLPHRVETKDYSGSGYDRGHMAPSADMKFDAQAMKECFYMSNICPQTHTLNAGAWSKLESACRRWANKFGRVYIVCGPIFNTGKQKQIGKEHKIPVPKAFFKCIYAVNKGKPQAIGFVMNNNSSKQNMNASAMTVDEVEKITGMDFFPNLPDKIENKVESEYSIKSWQ